MFYFACATLAHIALLGLAACYGGGFIWAALLYITLFTATLDRFVPYILPEMPEGAEFPTGARLSVLLGVLHFGLLFLALYSLVLGAHSLLEALALFVGFALFFGQVSHPNAHELIHRKERYARRLGRWVYASLLMGHHASAHVLVHHVHVGSEKDPNTAPRGMGFYRFFLKAWIASFRAGFKSEAARLARAGRPARHHPYLRDALIGLGLFLASYALGGGLGVGVYVGLALYAQVQILLADYVQHYGLRRMRLGPERYEPVSGAHSWNAPHWFSSALTLNAPRHSDHHMHPQRPYPALRLTPETMPTLPHALPVMAVIALYPPLYRRVMARAIGRLQEANKTA
jgi:alkane 1-monooxygenase